MSRRVERWLAALAVACALVGAVQGVRLQRVQAANREAEARFAAAAAATQAGRYDAAVTAWKSLVHGGREDLRRAALYNLGNLHLHQAMGIDPSDKVRSLPLVELAKQSYRDLLRADPDDWDARYNLERALWLAPEADESNEELPPPLQSERAITTMKSDRGGLP